MSRLDVITNARLADRQSDLDITFSLDQMNTHRTRSRNSIDNDAGDSVNRFRLLQPSELIP